MLDLIRRELMTIRFGERASSINSQHYLYGFLHCAYYHGGMLTGEAYAIAQAMIHNAVQHFHNDRMRETA